MKTVRRLAPRAILHRDLFLGRDPVSQKEIGDVQASNQQHKADRSQQEPENPLLLLGKKVILEALNGDAPAFVGGIGLRLQGGNPVHVSLRLRDSDTRFHASQPQGIGAAHG